MEAEEWAGRLEVEEWAGFPKASPAESFLGRESLRGNFEEVSPPSDPLRQLESVRMAPGLGVRDRSPLLYMIESWSPAGLSALPMLERPLRSKPREQSPLRPVSDEFSILYKSSLIEQSSG